MTGISAVSRRTRETLILTGERLFAEHGIDAVSLRRINMAAGQRNSSAAHYHFGSKDALIRAVFDYRMQRVNDRRLAMLDELANNGLESDVRAIVGAIVQPLVDETRQAGGCHYIRFMAQVIGHPQIGLQDIWNSPYTAGLARVMELLRASLPELPKIILNQRFGLMWVQTVHALANRERLSSAGQAPAVDAKLFVGNLEDMIAAGLAAPVSTGTTASLGRSGTGH